MKTAIMALCPVLLLTGCGALFDPNTALCRGEDPETTIQAIPGDLQFVVDNLDMFQPETHPLDGVTPGTIRNDLAENIDGCWAWVGLITERDTDSGKLSFPYRNREILAAAVYRFDVAAGLLQVQEFRGIDTTLNIWDDLPAVFILDREMTGLGDSDVEVDRLANDVALVLEDGSLRGDCVPWVAANAAQAVTLTATIEGDAMVISEAFNNPRTRLLIRFDCVDESIDLLPDSQPDGT